MGGEAFQSRISLPDAVSRFHVLKASDVLRMEMFHRQQDLEVDPISPEDCFLLLFISHRWETLSHPDPTGRQLAAIKSLIRLLCDAWSALSAESGADRLRFLPSLRQYGALQSLLLLSRFSASMFTFDSSIENKAANSWLPNHIGIWYDFACLPQKPRTDKQEQEFQASLLALPDLIRSEENNLIAIREAGDDYELRGWCFAEAQLSSGRMSQAPLVLRLDRLGRMYEYQIPKSVSVEDHSQLIRIKSALIAWETLEANTVKPEMIWEMVVKCACIAPDLLPLSSDDWPVLKLRDFAQASMTWIGLLVADMARQEGRVFDFSDVILRLLKDKGLHCSEDNDLIYIGLIALLYSCKKQSRVAEFFYQCLTRHVKNDGLFMRVEINGEPTAPYVQSEGGINSESLTWDFINK